MTANDSPSAMDTATLNARPTPEPELRPHDRVLHGILLLAATGVVFWLLTKPWAVAVILQKAGTLEGATFLKATGWQVALKPIEGVTPTVLAWALRVTAAMALFAALLGVQRLASTRRGHVLALAHLVSCLLALALLVYSVPAIAEFTQDRWRHTEFQRTPFPDSGDLSILRLVGYDLPESFRAAQFIKSGFQDPLRYTRSAILFLMIPLALYAAVSAVVRNSRAPDRLATVAYLLLAAGASLPWFSAFTVGPGDGDIGFAVVTWWSSVSPSPTALQRTLLTAIVGFGLLGVVATVILSHRIPATTRQLLRWVPLVLAGTATGVLFVTLPSNVGWPGRMVKALATGTSGLRLILGSIACLAALAVTHPRGR